MWMKFEANKSKAGLKDIIRIPFEVSEQFPSRGMVMLQVQMENQKYVLPAEPDGLGSHWFEVEENHTKEYKVLKNGTLSIEVEVLVEWPEPSVPEDILDAFEQASVLTFWNTFTTKARWEWLRWIRSTNHTETRNKRIQVAISKMEQGSRRPCCFDGTRCTVPEVSKSGVLLSE